MPTLSIPKDHVIVRAGPSTLNACIIFELCATVEPYNVSATKMARRGEDVKEVSCAWGLLPLRSVDGKQLDSKGYDLRLYYGSPEDQDFLPLMSSIEDGK